MLLFNESKKFLFASVDVATSSTGSTVVTVSVVTFSSVTPFSITFASSFSTLIGIFASLS